MDPTTTNQLGKRPMMLATDIMIETMPETPQRRGPHHRRALSDTSFRFDISSVSPADDDDLPLFDASDLDLSSLVADLPPTPPPPPSAPMAVDSDASSSAARPKPPVSHFRSLSVDSDFFDGLNLVSGRSSAAEEQAAAAGGSKRLGLHRHSNSMDGSSTASFDLDSSALVDGVKKAMGPDKLAELALIDPKRAKRILANRQSAARSKERKVRYTSELERKVQTLQTEATTLSAQVTMLQRDTTGLTAENKELKLRLQAMEQQAQLRDALNEALREEVQRLKIATGQIPAANGNTFNQGLPHQYSPHQPAVLTFGSHQNQPQQQLHMPQPSTNNQGRNGHPQPSFTNFS